MQNHRLTVILKFADLEAFVGFAKENGAVEIHVEPVGNGLGHPTIRSRKRRRTNHNTILALPERRRRFHRPNSKVAQADDALREKYHGQTLTRGEAERFLSAKRGVQSKEASSLVSHLLRENRLKVVKPLQ